VTKPEILGSIMSSYTRVVCMACAEKDIDFTLTETLLGAPILQGIHPLGKMPVLRHGDVTLFESKAIATYLDLVFDGPKLIPDNPRLAALTEQWVSFVNTTVDPVLIRVYVTAYALPRTADGKPDRALIEGVLPALRDHVTILDRAVAKTGYLAGNAFTLADINLMPILFYLRALPESAEAMMAARNLSAYYDRHAQRPSFQNTIPPLEPPRRHPPSA
jgi:glutathione S-transferase